MARSVELSVIAPALNEGANLNELVSRLVRVFEGKGIDGEIVIVDDGSTDDTPLIADQLAADHDQVVVVHHGQNRGIAPSWQTGLEHSRGRFVCIIDSDLQYQPEDVWRLYRENQATSADIVQGYRSSLTWSRGLRYSLSRGLNRILNLGFGMRLHDNKSGFLLCRREVFGAILRRRYRYHYFQTFIAVSAAAKGYTIRDIEVLFAPRLLGESLVPRFPLKVVALSVADVVKAFFEFRFHRRGGLPESLDGYLADRPSAREPERLPFGRRARFAAYERTMPLHHWFITRSAADRYRELTRSQWMDPEELRRLQQIKLRKLLHHAYGHVTYYRELFDALGIKPGAIEDADDLAQLPFLTKDHVREHLYFDLLSDNHEKEKIQRIATSGSTGEPFVCYVDRMQMEMRWAATLRGMEWTGWRFGDPQVRLWHQTLGMSRSQVRKERLDARFQKRLFVPAFEMTDESLAQFGQLLARHRPVLIDGYAESLNFLAHYLRDRGMEGVRPKGIISSAQILPKQSRETIERAFDCRVFDKYGAREFSGIAWECEAHSGHHVVAESYVVEIIKDGRPAAPGELGEVVITDLNNYCMPFIRYRIGDLARALPRDEICACGRALPMIGAIEGRAQAIVLATNGRYLPGTFFAHFFKDYDFIVRQYQIVQHTRGELTLRVVKAPRFDAGVFDRLLGELRQYVGQDMRIEVRFEDSIEMVRTGKQRGVVSHLDLDFQELAVGGRE